jgi:hypothetical protein
MWPLHHQWFTNPDNPHAGLPWPRGLEGLAACEAPRQKSAREKWARRRGLAIAAAARAAMELKRPRQKTDVLTKKTKPLSTTLNEKNNHPKRVLDQPHYEGYGGGRGKGKGKGKGGKGAWASYVYHDDRHDYPSECDTRERERAAPRPLISPLAPCPPAWRGRRPRRHSPHSRLGLPSAAALPRPFGCAVCCWVGGWRTNCALSLPRIASFVCGEVW